MKDELRDIMGHYATGASIVTATWQGKPYGLAVNSFTSASLEPPLILFCPAKQSDTWPVIRRAGHFAVNILRHDQDRLCSIFAEKNVDRFAEVAYHLSSNGNPILHGALTYLDCAIERIYEAGDHYITLGQVLELGARDDSPPLVFYRGGFHELAGL